MQKMTPNKPSTHAPVHPDCPRKLKSAFRHARWNMRALTKNLGINIYYISRAIRLGERPHNKNIATALFFARPYRKGMIKKADRDMPIHIKWWRNQSGETRNALIYNLWTQTLQP
jgi:hypothetical protein